MHVCTFFAYGTACQSDFQMVSVGRCAVLIYIFYGRTILCEIALSFLEARDLENVPPL